MHRGRLVATMRSVCYLGTRGCPGVLEEALRDHFDPLAILVPTEPRLLGSALADDLGEALTAVAEVLAQRAREHAVEIAARNAEEVAGVFEPAGDPAERIQTHVLEPPLETTLAETAQAAEAEECYLSRDALDVLDGAGVHPGPTLARVGIELVTR